MNELMVQMGRFLREVGRRASENRLARHAASLSFSSLLALAPMMAIAFSMLSLFSAFEHMGQSVQNFIYAYLVPTAGDDIKVYLEQFASQAGKLTLVGLFFFLLTALVLLVNIESSFNDIWGVEKGRTITARLTVYWALVSLGPLLMGASLSVSTYLLSLSMFTGNVASTGLVLIPFVLEWAAFLLLYLVMPNVVVSFKHAAIGAVIAAVLFEISKRAFALYITHFASYEIVYGALSTLPIFLLWVYVSWVIALMGAVLVAALQYRSSSAED